MKYYVIEAMTTGDTVAKAVREYDTENIAFMNFHQVLASALTNGNVDKGFCSVLNEYGAVVRNEYFQK